MSNQKLVKANKMRQKFPVFFAVRLQFGLRRAMFTKTTPNLMERDESL